jgi:hypothetical protein
MRIHDLKCWPPFFHLIQERLKTAEVRLNDRDYRVDDLLLLREYLPDETLIQEYLSGQAAADARLELEELADMTRGDYTGNLQIARVVGVLEGLPGLREGFVLLSFERLELVPVDVEADTPGGLTR